MNLQPGEVGSHKRERGFVLVTVLWIAGLLVMLGATFSLSVRTHVQIAANLTASAIAESFADAGVSLAILDLAKTRDDASAIARIRANSGAFACSIGNDGSVVIRVREEGAVIDINTAGVPILQALLVGLKEPPDRALAIAEAIFDYRDDDDLRKAHGAERAEYLAAGLAWTPKNALFDSVEELAQVLGMTPALLAKMRPYVGVHSGLAGVDAGSAKPELLEILRDGVAGISGTFGSFPDFDPEHAIPAIFNTPSQHHVFTVYSEGMSHSGAVFVREAVVDIGAGTSSNPRILRWQHGQYTANATTKRSLPPC